MSYIIKINDSDRVDGQTIDSRKYNKDCFDFICLDDATVVGDCKYCNLSLVCRQVDILPDGETVPMEGNLLPVYNEHGELIEHQIFCTGMYDLRPLKERYEDDKVS